MSKRRRFSCRLAVRKLLQLLLLPTSFHGDKVTVISAASPVSFHREKVVSASSPASKLLQFLRLLLRRRCAYSNEKSSFGVTAVDFDNLKSTLFSDLM
ncbi:hypothetical protein RDI58_019509 [Solanum bulbocastanum]|uniref:Uncharacterized protein n=1 Tax=Solanum bulbocastanum TaxID=147425 RepID=A0AAN8T4K7_SOLBU